jgi:hypothetical protein
LEVNVMTRAFRVLKAIVITGAASGYLMQTCTNAGHGFSILPNIGRILSLGTLTT